ncbi:MAG: hypothetical protein ACEPOV_00110 [Hyphomicrobiales bacterium]
MEKLIFVVIWIVIGIIVSVLRSNNKKQRSSANTFSNNKEESTNETFIDFEDIKELIEKQEKEYTQMSQQQNRGLYSEEETMYTAENADMKKHEATQYNSPYNTNARIDKKNKLTSLSQDNSERPIASDIPSDSEDNHVQHIPVEKLKEILISDPQSAFILSEILNRPYK